MRSYYARKRSTRRAPEAPGPARISVEVIFAEPQRSIAKMFSLPSPATIEDVLLLAAADPDFSGIDIAHAAVGVYGRPTRVTEPLNDRDRVEIYRPLAADPKSARRARAQEARKKP